MLVVRMFVVIQTTDRKSDTWWCLCVFSGDDGG